MKSFFVGSKSKPSFLVEVTPKKITVYQPDEYSKEEEFYERYSLGKKVMETNYSKMLHLFLIQLSI
jgi:hypothetical protein